MLKQRDQLEVKQFQESDSKSNVLPVLKKCDTKALLCLMLPLLEIKLKLKQYDLVISDLGCGEGNMLLTLLQQLYENLENYLQLRITIFACEPSETLRNIFRAKFKSTDKKGFLSVIKNVEVNEDTIENYNPKQSDIFLFSHTLYYPQTIWNTGRYPKLEFDDHLFTRCLSALKESGLIVVILQSGKPTEIKAVSGSCVTNHEGFEDVMYPVVTGQNNRERKTFTNAEIFENCLATYAEKYYEKHGEKLTYKTAPSLAIIPLGELNFTDLDSATNQYKQAESVTLLLNFYTRGNYSKMTAGEQRKILTFIRNNCVDTSGSCIMCHLNRVFIVMKNKDFEIKPTPTKAFTSF